jgi:hypothetical protein
LDTLEAAFKEHGGLEENLSIDDRISFRHFAKQFITGKPVCFGPLFNGGGGGGYMITFQVYTGKYNDRTQQFVFEETLYCHLSMLMELQPVDSIRCSLIILSPWKNYSSTLY